MDLFTIYIIFVINIQKYMNCKYPTIEFYRTKFYTKFPESKLNILEFVDNRKVKIQTKYGVCICDKDNLLWYGSTTIKTSINKTNYFINLSKEIHNNKYDYNLSKYIDCQTKIKIFCKIHGIFKQSPSSHLNGSGCPKCGSNSTKLKKTKTEEEYIKELTKIHNGKYQIKKGTYINSNTNILHYCTTQKEWFNIRPSHLLKGKGCRKCVNLLISERCKKESVGWSYSSWGKSGLCSKHFDSFKVYILKCYNDDEIFYKIGKTYQTINRRFQSKREIPYKWEIIKIFVGKSKIMSELETKLKNMNKENKYLPKIKFNGRFECYLKLEKYEEFFT